MGGTARRNFIIGAIAFVAIGIVGIVGFVLGRNKTEAESQGYSFEDALKLDIYKNADLEIGTYLEDGAVASAVSWVYDVLEKVHKTNPDTALLFVGGGPYLEELKELAESRGLKDSVAFTGYAAREDLVYFYKMSSIFVFPSLTETQGLVTIEAMTVGVPVVAIGEMGTVDVMQGDNGGFMVKNDVDEFTSKVQLLLNDRHVYEAKSEEAKVWAKQWSIESLTPTLVKYYQKAVELKKQESEASQS